MILLIHRAMAFMKRLLICATQSSSQITAGIIFLLAEVCRGRPELLKMITTVESLGINLILYYILNAIVTIKL